MSGHAGAGLSVLTVEVLELYSELDAQIAGQGPVCVNRGLCCQFGRFGHRLYVGSAELAAFVEVQSADPRGLVPVDRELGRCPYQVDGRCTVRGHRPLGCRIYFCDAGAQGWQAKLYEQFHARLVEIGSRHGRAYAYTEWLTALAEQAERTGTGGDQSAEVLSSRAASAR